MTKPAPTVTTIAASDFDWLRSQTTAIPVKSAVFRLAGPGVVECIQGILTNDVESAGIGSLVYGAILTPKGMIVVDLWVFRDRDAFTVVAPSHAHGLVEEIFAKRFPPRLVTVKDASGDWSTAWLAGPGVGEALTQLGESLPSVSWKTVALDGEEPLVLGRPGELAPWSGLLVGTSGRVKALLDRLQAAGTLIGGPDHQEALRILGGWPGLGAEIGEKTLPQEVRFDEIGGVSHTKGCYVGQETVARVHFRGHPNRTLRGVVWRGASFPPGTQVFSAEKDVGRLTSVLECDDFRVALSLVRREVETGVEVSLGEPGGALGTLRLPPFWDLVDHS